MAETQRSRPGKGGSREAIATEHSTTCRGCGLRFVDEWERVKHEVTGLHHYWSAARRGPYSPLIAAERIPVRDLPARADLRKQCHRCLKPADDAELFVLGGRYYHREACTP